MIEIAWAVRLTDGRIVGVDQVDGGLACGCVCSECRQTLVAAKGEVNQHHFRHHADPLSVCGGGQETALHMLAKTIVSEAAFIVLPGDETRNVSSSEMEPQLEDTRPDVLLHTPGGDVAVEIAVTHRTGEAKIARYAALRLAAIEIDISMYLGATASYGELKRAVLSHAARRWLKVREKRDTPARKKEPKDWLYHATSAAESQPRTPSPPAVDYWFPRDNLGDAWSRGFKAREDREAVDSNPYRPGFDRNREWIKGWNAAVHVPPNEG